jgi:hypothetical protein
MNACGSPGCASKRSVNTVSKKAVDVGMVWVVVRKMSEPGVLECANKRDWRALRTTNDAKEAHGMSKD